MALFNLSSARMYAVRLLGRPLDLIRVGPQRVLSNHPLSILETHYICSLVPVASTILRYKNVEW